MKRGSLPADVDLRGFVWPLSPLEFRLEIAVQRASAEVASRERKRIASQAELDTMEREHRQHLSWLGRGERPMDLAQRREGLRYLSAALDRLQMQQREVDRCAEELGAARNAQGLAHRRLESVRQLHEDAVRLYVTQERLRAGKEADQAWLAAVGHARRRDWKGSTA